MPLQMTRGRGRKRQQYMHQQGSLQCPPVSKMLHCNIVGRNPTNKAHCIHNSIPN